MDATLMGNQQQHLVVPSMSSNGITILLCTCGIQLVNAVIQALGTISLGIIKDDLYRRKGELPLALAATQQGFGLLFLITAVLADRWGRRIVHALSLVTLGLWLCAGAITYNFIQLVICRVFQGTATGMFTAATFQLVTDHFSRFDRAMAMVLFVSTREIGTAVGALVGKDLITALGWRNFHYLSALITITLAIVAGIALPKDRTRSASGRRPSFTRAVLFTVGILYLSHWLFLNGRILHNALTDMVVAGGWITGLTYL